MLIGFVHQIRLLLFLYYSSKLIEFIFNGKSSGEHWCELLNKVCPQYLIKNLRSFLRLRKETIRAYMNCSDFIKYSSAAKQSFEVDTKRVSTSRDRSTYISADSNTRLHFVKGLCHFNGCLSHMDQRMPMRVCTLVQTRQSIRYSHTKSMKINVYSILTLNI